MSEYMCECVYAGVCVFVHVSVCLKPLVLLPAVPRILTSLPSPGVAPRISHFSVFHQAWQCCLLPSVYAQTYLGAEQPQRPPMDSPLQEML